MSEHTLEELAQLATEAGERLSKERAEREAEASSRWRDDEERRLCLQQAAPDLLAACEECLDAEERRAAALTPGAPASTYTAQRIARLRAAIAKARTAEPGEFRTSISETFNSGDGT
jgi:hypothetical protein